MSLSAGLRAAACSSTTPSCTRRFTKVSPTRGCGASQPHLTLAPAPGGRGGAGRQGDCAQSLLLPRRLQGCRHLRPVGATRCSPWLAPERAGAPFLARWGSPITSSPCCFRVVERPGAPCPVEPLQPPPHPAPGLAPVLTCSPATALPARHKPGEPLPAVAASMNGFRRPPGLCRLRCRQPRHPLALARSSTAGCSSPGARQQLSADVPAASLSPMQREKLHAGLVCCLSPSLMEAVLLQLSRINRH